VHRPGFFVFRELHHHMADSNKKQLQTWQERIAAGCKVYDRWAQDYHVQTLSDYYEGFQWGGRKGGAAGQPVTLSTPEGRYTINLVFPTVETQLPTLMYTKPQIKCDPRPGHADDVNSQALARAELLKHTLQTLIDDEDSVHFGFETDLSLRDVYARFAVVEVGYSADYLDNPNAGKPLLKDDTDEPMLDSDGEPVLAPEQVRTGESIYIKRIPPQNFRVSVSGRNRLEANDWYAYSEWHYVEDIKRNPLYTNTKTLKPSGTLADVIDERDAADAEEHGRYAGMVKIWKIWDLRAKVKRVFAVGHDKWLLEGEPFTFAPHAVLKFYERADEFYPLPAINWLSPQDEINETRDTQRIHRKRFTRRYLVKKGAIDQQELDKIETGEDGAYAFSNADPAETMQAVPDAPLDGANWAHLAATRDDFSLITGTTGEQRGTPEAQTATQANITNVRSQLRESKCRAQVGAWLAHICRLIARTLIERMQDPFMVKVGVDPFAADLRSVLQTVQTWVQLTAEELGPLAADIKVDIASLSPVAEDQERAAWLTALQVITNPVYAPWFFAPNPEMLQTGFAPNPLLRKTLAYFGIKTEAEVREIARVGVQIFLANQMQAALSAATAGSPGGAPGLPATGAPKAPAAGLPAAAPGIAA
jgi:hypothetical protein